jgi:ribosomal RNA-processing protein 12
MKNAALAAQPTQPRLAFFQSTVLQMARECDKLTAASATTSTMRNLYKTRVIELWSLFPCFCKSPIDVDDILPAMASILAKALADKRYPELVVRILTILFQKFLAFVEFTHI